jgi:hypothetical protein
MLPPSGPPSLMPRSTVRQRAPANVGRGQRGRSPRLRPGTRPIAPRPLRPTAFPAAPTATFMPPRPNYASRTYSNTGNRMPSVRDQPPVASSSVAARQTDDRPNFVRVDQNQNREIPSASISQEVDAVSSRFMCHQFSKDFLLHGISDTESQALPCTVYTLIDNIRLAVSG